MLAKFVSKEQGNINKGKGKHLKIEERKRKNVFQKGVDGQKAKKKDENLKGKTKGKQGQKKIEQKEEKDFKHKPFGKTKEEKPQKLQENSLFVRLSPPQTEQKQGENNDQSSKNKQKNTFVHVGKQSPILGKFQF